MPLGSSPLARGAPFNAMSNRLFSGLIPAHAGSTTEVISWKYGLWAHPRPCGEHYGAQPRESSALGSSPPVRGAPLRSWCGVFPWRLIPARAGSTCRRAESGRAGRAHPRSRGEHAPERAAVWSRQGSSPLARGALVALDSVARGIGLIPARAGSTESFWIPSFACWAHPRSRGEHLDNAKYGKFSKGSSPLARGARLLVPVSGDQRGLIPARAGSTERQQQWRS